MPTISKRSLRILFVALMLVLAAFGVASAQSSPTFDLTVAALTPGGSVSNSTNFQVEMNFGDFGGIASAGTAQITSGLTAVAAGANPFAPDAFEADDACANAQPIQVNATSPQQRSFHREGDSDWGYFDTQAGRSYVIEATNIGPKANAVIALYSDCETLDGTGDGTFGSTVRLEWNATAAQRFFVQFQAHDPAQFGSPADTQYRISVSSDTVAPPAPTGARCEAKSANTVAIQWTKSAARDVVTYRIQYAGNRSGTANVQGRNTTYFDLGGLTGGSAYQVRIQAIDFSGNVGAQSAAITCTPTPPTDRTAPAFVLTQPNSANAYTTSAALLTVVGNATDAGRNLARARVRIGATELFDESLKGAASNFRVENVPLSVGANNIEVAVLDAVGNVTLRNITVTRTGISAGAVVIVAGHNEAFGLQANIYNSANRAYRIFKNAGYPDASIFYMAPVNQDADGNGTNDVDALGSPANLQAMLTGPVKALLTSQSASAAKPLFVYMIDHGFAEKFCLAGCTSGSFTPAQLDAWLQNVEQVPNVSTTVVMEACQSGSFLDKTENPASSISRQGRVVITSTGRLNNAYASDAGAYFSDAFFSCLVDSKDLTACFNEGRAAVTATGVRQTPWLDDTGDGVFNNSDGAVARTYFMTRNFNSIRPALAASQVQTGAAAGANTVTLRAYVAEGAEEVTEVWAAIYPPGFVEPNDVTLNLNVPRVRLLPVLDNPGEFIGEVPSEITLQPTSRVLFYAVDSKGISSAPYIMGEEPMTYLPLVVR